MEDIYRLWRLFLAALHGGFTFVSYFSNRSPLPLGYVLIVLAVLVMVYQKRRAFYGGLDVAADWRPTYGSIITAQGYNLLLSSLFWLALFFGAMVLFRHYLPVLFEDISGFLISMTAAS